MTWSRLSRRGWSSCEHAHARTTRTVRGKGSPSDGRGALGLGLDWPLRCAPPPLSAALTPAAFVLQCHVVAAPAAQRRAAGRGCRPRAFARGGPAGTGAQAAATRRAGHECGQPAHPCLCWPCRGCACRAAGRGCMPRAFARGGPAWTGAQAAAARRAGHECGQPAHLCLCWPPSCSAALAGGGGHRWSSGTRLSTPSCAMFSTFSTIRRGGGCAGCCARRC